MQPFDLLNAPLAGISLIEAGAGTGKTHNITGLYLRLLAEKGLTVDQILVVTFTKAATEELKNRIRQRLITFRRILRDGQGDTELVQEILERTSSKDLVLQRIDDALVSFDKAAVFTIHGFCQRLLQHFAFETGHLFHTELVTDQQELVLEAADDFWRRYVSSAPDELVQAVLDELKRPETLADIFNQGRCAGMRVLPEDVKPPLTAIAGWRRAAREVACRWPRERGAIIDQLNSAGLNGRRFGKIAPDPKHPGKTFRQVRVEALAAAMDLWDGRFPVFDQFERLGSGFLQESVNKGGTPPDHPFFDLCQQALDQKALMEPQLLAYVRYLKVHWHRWAAPMLAEKKAARGIMSFDDLLLLVAAALRQERGRYLVRAVREQYRAALVDEFQDTDPVQYEIFQRLFGSEPALLFMIGDPKQAIYSFRGADLFSYLRAAEKAANRFTLQTNYRSSASLVQAFNAVFGRHPQPFGLDKIIYHPAAAFQGGDPHPEPSLFLWHIETGCEVGGASPPVSKKACLPLIVPAVADEIVRLIGGRAPTCRPEEIAVLTRSHRQAQLVKRELSRAGVPAVLHSAGSVFDSDEAAELNFILQAAAAPADPGHVRAALATGLLGATAAEFYDAPGEQGESGWQRRWPQFGEYHRKWVRDGFHRMFNLLLKREGIKKRMLSLPDGERRMTNVLHLGELLHQAALEHHMGPEGLVRWLSAQRAAGPQNEESRQLRLESDASAVRIITIHKSKGLQFEIVFCPFTYAGATAANDRMVIFHDPEADDAPTMAIGPGIDQAHQRRALEEELSENLRLLYVAMTRARRRCYWVWGRIRNCEVSAPGYLLHADLSEPGDYAGRIEALEARMKNLDDAAFAADLDALAADGRGSIEVCPLRAPAGLRLGDIAANTVGLSHRTRRRLLSGDWRIASYSSWAGGRHAGTDSAGGAGWADLMGDRPERDERAVVAASQIAGFGEQQRGPVVPLADFPKGAAAGLFFHDLLENLDFADPDDGARRRLVDEKLLTHGFEPHRAAAVDSMLKELLSVRLPAAEGGLCLRQVRAQHRVNEMEFYFPLQRIDGERLRELYGRHQPAALRGQLQRGLEQLDFKPMQGYMKGFIDLFFEHDGRYYLVDWKSNHLGDHAGDYDLAGLSAAMAGECYFLQYHLYTLALDCYLRRRRVGYDYKRHFGGVFYIFLRGVQASGGSGIFFDLPRPEMMNSLRGLLMGIDSPAAAEGTAGTNIKAADLA